MKIVLMLAVLAVLSGCASVRSGNIAKPNTKGTDEDTSKRGLIVSGEENTRLSGKYFANLDFTFENKTERFIKVKKVYLDFGSPALNEKIKIPVGNQLVSWATAAQHKADISDHNTAVMLGSVAALGGAAAGLSKDQNVRAAGVGVVAGAAGVAGTKGIQNNLRNLEYAPLYPGSTDYSQAVPPTHLYHGGFEIPPDLHTKHWVTLYTETPNEIPFITYMNMIVQYEDGAEEKFKLTFRGHNFSSSEWQADHQDRLALQSHFGAKPTALDGAKPPPPPKTKAQERFDKL